MVSGRAFAQGLDKGVWRDHLQVAQQVCHVPWIGYLALTYMMNETSMNTSRTLLELLGCITNTRHDGACTNGFDAGL